MIELLMVLFITVPLLAMFIDMMYDDSTQGSVKRNSPYIADLNMDDITPRKSDRNEPYISDFDMNDGIPLLTDIVHCPQKIEDK